MAIPNLMYRTKNQHLDQLWKHLSGLTLKFDTTYIRSPEEQWQLNTHGHIKGFLGCIYSLMISNFYTARKIEAYYLFVFHITIPRSIDGQKPAKITK
jgi:hypothetical protein